jgi:hypothetical protein
MRMLEVGMRKKLNTTRICSQSRVLPRFIGDFHRPSCHLSRCLCDHTTADEAEIMPLEVLTGRCLLPSASI